MTSSRAGVFLDGRLVMSRAEICAWSWKLDIKRRCHLTLNGARKFLGYTVVFDTECQATEFVEALHLPAGPAFGLRRCGTVATWWFVLIGIGALAESLLRIASQGQFARWPAIAAVGITLVSMLLTHRFRYDLVTLTADGLRIGSSLGLRERFVSFADFRGVSAHGSSLRIEPANGAPFVLRFTSAWRAADAAKRVREAAAQAEDAAIAIAEVPTLARAGRSTLDWVATLRSALSTHAASYRDGAASAETLKQLLSNAKAPMAKRLAAAIALTRGEPGGSAKTEIDLHAAADAVGWKDLERSLRRVADGADDVELARLLEEAEAVRATGHLHE